MKKKKKICQSSSCWTFLRYAELYLVYLCVQVIIYTLLVTTICNLCSLQYLPPGFMHLCMSASADEFDTFLHIVIVHDNTYKYIIHLYERVDLSHVWFIYIFLFWGKFYPEMLFWYYYYIIIIWGCYMWCWLQFFLNLLTLVRMYVAGGDRMHILDKSSKQQYAKIWDPKCVKNRNAVLSCICKRMLPIKKSRQWDWPLYITLDSGGLGFSRRVSTFA